MKLQPDPFDKIKDGSKIIESRLYDEKRQQVQLGDTIVFQKNPQLQEEIKTEIVGLLRYPSFDLMMTDLPPVIFGGDSKESLLEELRQFYSTEEEKKYGVLGIRIKVLS